MVKGIYLLRLKLLSACQVLQGAFATTVSAEKQQVKVAADGSTHGTPMAPTASLAQWDESLDKSGPPGPPATLPLGMHDWKGPRTSFSVSESTF